jgi:hypothetical protein
MASFDKAATHTVEANLRGSRVLLGAATIMCSAGRASSDYRDLIET